MWSTPRAYRRASAEGPPWCYPLAIWQCGGRMFESDLSFLPWRMPDVILVARPWREAAPQVHRRG